MQNVSLSSLDTVEVYGIPADLIAHGLLGLCISLFFILAGFRPVVSFLIVLAFAVAKEAIDGLSEFASSDPTDAIVDILVSLVGAFVGILFRPKQKSGFGDATSTSKSTQQPPLVITDKHAIPRATRILGILKREDKKKR